MIQISRQVDYAVQFLTRLAALQKNETLSLKSFSKESNISFLFLQKIARLLKKAGFIAAQKGIHGGYSLAISIDSISIKSVIEAVEGPYGIVDCAKGEHICSKSGSCQAKYLWQAINKNIMAELEKTSIAAFKQS